MLPACRPAQDAHPSRLHPPHLPLPHAVVSPARCAMLCCAVLCCVVQSVPSCRFSAATRVHGNRQHCLNLCRRSAATRTPPPCGAPAGRPCCPSRSPAPRSPAPSLQADPAALLSLGVVRPGHDPGGRPGRVPAAGRGGDWRADRGGELIIRFAHLIVCFSGECRSRRSVSSLQTTGLLFCLSLGGAVSVPVSHCCCWACGTTSLPKAERPLASGPPPYPFLFPLFAARLHPAPGGH